jgi:hypothetical protein
MNPASFHVHHESHFRPQFKTLGRADSHIHLLQTLQSAFRVLPSYFPHSKSPMACRLPPRNTTALLIAAPKALRSTLIGLDRLHYAIGVSQSLGSPTIPPSRSPNFTLQTLSQWPRPDRPVPLSCLRAFLIQTHTIPSAFPRPHGLV